MTTNPNPWRARNLQQIAEARRILTDARARTSLRPDQDGDAEGGKASGDPHATTGTPDATPDPDTTDNPKEGP